MLKQFVGIGLKTLLYLTAAVAGNCPIFCTFILLFAVMVDQIVFDVLGSRVLFSSTR